MEIPQIFLYCMPFMLNFQGFCFANTKITQINYIRPGTTIFYSLVIYGMSQPQNYINNRREATIQNVVSSSLFINYIFSVYFMHSLYMQSGCLFEWQ